MKFLYPGTFNPFTFGHYSIYLKACKLFGEDNVYLGIAVNPKKRVSSELIAYTLEEITKKRVLIPNEITTAKFCQDNGFDCIIRSIRNTMDSIEEMNLAHWNRTLGLETIFIPCDEELQKISSTAIRELYKLNESISLYVPPPVLKRWVKISRTIHTPL